MVYSSEEKARMDRLAEAISEYIAVSPEFDIAYTEKSGYLWLVISQLEADRVYSLQKLEKLIAYWAVSPLLP